MPLQIYLFDGAKSLSYVHTDATTPNTVGLHVAKCLTGFKLCATALNNTQQHATGCPNGRNM